MVPENSESIGIIGISGFPRRVLAKQGKYSEAMRYHQKAIRLDPSKADESYFNLGLVLRAEESLSRPYGILRKRSRSIQSMKRQ